MKLSIQARNMSVSPAITQRIEKKTETMGKYLWPETEMLVKMRKDHRPHGKERNPAQRVLRGR